MSKNVIVVAGDRCVDQLIREVPAASKASNKHGSLRNWQLKPGQRSCELPGGADLLAEFIGAASAESRVIHLPMKQPQQALRSIIHVAAFDQSPEEKRKKKKNRIRILRVNRVGGFQAPAGKTNQLPEWKARDSEADLVVLDDPGNGFRDANNEKAWPGAFRARSKNKPTIILKTARPLAQGALWNELAKKHLSRLVVIIDADDLREEGANISKGLSWERTALNCVWELEHGHFANSIGTCPHVIVRFGLDGALYRHKRGGKFASELFYDPSSIEGDFWNKLEGSMVGLNAAFTATIARDVAKRGPRGIADAIPEAIERSHLLRRLGFGGADEADPSAEDLQYPAQSLFSEACDSTYIAQVSVDRPTFAFAGGTTDWSICDDQCGSQLSEFAKALVIDGRVPTLDAVPRAKIGKLETIDRSEIESFRAVRTLMDEYIRTENPPRPLCIAVFGAPGSGKSFGVSEVADSFGSAGGESPITKKGLTFNVSQFERPDDIAKALHKVRDVVLSGKIPLVFFDEFDSAVGGQSLAWLQHFLMPMQDGTFRDGEAIHPIGKAIFVFAGGTSNSYDDFSAGLVFDKNPELQFQNVKGPDFLSRLRGYVNIAGPNAVTATDTQSRLRRAGLIRSFIERTAPQILDGDKAAIDEHLVYALLHVSRYKHGIRSLESIFDMSRLAGLNQFQSAALPPKNQLDMHVPALEFFEILRLGPSIDGLAEQIHQNYRRRQAGKKPKSDPSMQPWDTLREDLRESNRQQAAHIPVKLRAIGKTFLPDSGRFTNRPFSKATIEQLAIVEHDRWVEERRIAGWQYGEVRDTARKISPYLVSWDELKGMKNNPQQWDRDAVKDIPRILKAAGYRILDL